MGKKMFQEDGIEIVESSFQKETLKIQTKN